MHLVVKFGVNFRPNTALHPMGNLLTFMINGYRPSTFMQELQ